MNQPNPFVDDKRLIGASIAAQQSADVLSNPYASPIAINTGAPSEIVGCWREDDFLVIHRTAKLPPLCIFCGCAASHEKLWARASMWKLQPKLYAGICDRCGRGRRLFNRYKYLSLVVLLPSLILYLFLSFRGYYISAFSILLMYLSVIFALFSFSRKFNQPLNICQREGSYIWLQGAGPQFLAKLPSLEFAPPPRGAS